MTKKQVIKWARDFYHQPMLTKAYCKKHYTYGKEVTVYRIGHIMQGPFPMFSIDGEGLTWAEAVANAVKTKEDEHRRYPQIINSILNPYRKGIT